MTYDNEVSAGIQNHTGRMRKSKKHIFMSSNQHFIVASSASYSKNKLYWLG